MNGTLLAASVLHLPALRHTGRYFLPFPTASLYPTLSAGSEMCPVLLPAQLEKELDSSPSSLEWKVWNFCFSFSYQVWLAMQIAYLKIFKYLSCPSPLHHAASMGAAKSTGRALYIPSFRGTPAIRHCLYSHHGYSPIWAQVGLASILTPQVS